jgi:ribokinase
MGTVWVVGSINIDLVIETAELPRPGETIGARSLRRLPGGKGANQAVASALLGAATRMVGLVGDDDAGPFLVEFMADLGVDVSDVRTHAGSSGTAVVVVDEQGQNMIIVVAGVNATLASDDLRHLEVRAGDVVLTQNEISVTASVAAIEMARWSGATSIHNPSPATGESLAVARSADIVVVNETELALLSGRRVDEHSPIDELGGAMAEIRDDRPVIVTLGARGVAATIDGELFELPAIPTTVVDSTGAGDAFVAGLAARLAMGEELRSALDVALAAASIVVTRWGAGPSMPTAVEVASLTSRTRRTT